jgi:sulfur-carrier protein
MITVSLPAALVALFPGCPRELTVQAGSVAEVVTQLDARWPGMRDRLCDSTPALRRHIHVFAGNDRAMLETALAPGTELLVVTAISGG